ncbi:MAG: ribonuclease Z [Thermoleophilia bacterium]|nr:ribonuclease Z [Thermoleophilia bacterium]
MPKNPYGPHPGGGISLSGEYRPTPSVTNRNYFPANEPLAKGEMRISFPGSTPWPPTLSQSGTAIMVELGTGEFQPRRFFFDMGNGSVKNILGLGVLPMAINDIFISHLHVDHYHDLIYMLPFTATMGRFKPLRVYGPSGARPDLGTANMVEKMREMLVWHIENFEHWPIGDGCEVDCTEFDWQDENGVCYEQEGVTVRHWPRSHVKDGASAYRLDWEEGEMSFVWTGDGRPDEKTVEYSQGVDVFVSEGQVDLPSIVAMKWGTPEFMTEYTLDTYHTPYYAAGKLFSEVGPRLAMITHTNYEEELMGESVAEVRALWKGMFMFGAPDVMVVNVTKDAIWGRKAAIPPGAASGSMDPRAMFPPGQMPEKLRMPDPARPREEQQEQFLRDMELDPDDYYPADAKRDISDVWPDEGVEMDVETLLKAKGVDLDDDD